MTAEFVVSGRVQGVGFRYFVARTAVRLGITGFAANLPDGRVEVLARGGTEALDRFEEALRSGPPSAVVTGVEKLWISDERPVPKAFEIR